MTMPPTGTQWRSSPDELAGGAALGFPFAGTNARSKKDDDRTRAVLKSLPRVIEASVKVGPKFAGPVGIWEARASATL
jgi:hypothetical protein